MSALEFFSEVTEESARSYVAHLKSRAPARLADLAGWVAATDGPVDELDGTRDSLLPLGAWLIEFILAGAPGVPADAVSSRARFLQWGVSGFRDLARLQHATEPIAHYLFEVIRREYPDAAWTLQPGRTIRDSDFQEPVVFAAGRGFPLDQAMANRPSAIVEGWGRGRSQDGLLRLLNDLPPTALDVAPEPILVPFLARPVARDDPIREVPVARRRGEVPTPTGQGMASESIVFAPTGADFADLDAIPPFDERQLASALTALGYVDGGQPVSAAALVNPMTTLVLGDDIALLEPVPSSGRLRFLTFDTINATDEQFDRLRSGLERLAGDVGAYFGPAVRTR